jgi:hypothetical protein
MANQASISHFQSPPQSKPPKKLKKINQTSTVQ